MKLLVWGIGGYSHKYIENGKENYILDEYLVGGIDSNKEKQNMHLRGKTIYSPATPPPEKFDYLLVGSIRYENEIIAHAEEVGLGGQIIPFDLWCCRYQDAFNSGVSFMLKNFTDITIIKNWHVCAGEKEQIILSVTNSLDKILNLKIIPYGGFGKNFIAYDNDSISIKDISTGITLKSKLFRENTFNIELKSNNVILTIEMPLNRFGILLPTFVSSETSNAVNKIEQVEVRKSLKFNTTRINDFCWHDLDYSFLGAFDDLYKYCILDIGANVGQSSITFLKNSSANIVAYEPNPNFYTVLDIVCTVYGKGRMRVIKAGVGDVNDSMMFYVPKCDGECSQQGSFEKEAALRRAYQVSPLGEVSDEDLIRQIIPIVRVDDSFDNEKPVVFIKVDVESFELNAIKGMSKIISRYRPIILLEYSSDEQQQEIFKVINSFAQYDIYYWDYICKGFYKENHRGGINYFLLPFSSGLPEIKDKLTRLIKE